MPWKQYANTDLPAKTKLHARLAETRGIEMMGNRKLLLASLLALAETMRVEDYPMVGPIGARRTPRKPHWKELQTEEEREVALRKAQEKRERKAAKRAAQKRSRQ